MRLVGKYIFGPEEHSFQTCDGKNIYDVDWDSAKEVRDFYRENVQYPYQALFLSLNAAKITAAPENELAPADGGLVIEEVGEYSFNFPLACHDVLGKSSLNSVQIGAPLLEAAPILTGYGYQTASKVASSCHTFYREGEFEDSVYFMFVNGAVATISVSAERESYIRTLKGVGVGSSEQEVRDSYQSITTLPHPYGDEIDRYLEVTLDNGNGLIFKVVEGEVKSFKLGRYPEVKWAIEGCS